MRASLCLFACLATLLVACPDFSGLSSGGPGDGGSSSGALDAAGADAASNDAMFVDASGDSGRSPCAAAHDFCDDFETGELLDHWTSKAVDNGGRLESSSDRAAQGTRSLSVYLPAQPGDGVFRTASVRKAFVQAWRHAIINVDMWLEPLSAKPADTGSGLLIWTYQAAGDAASTFQKGVYFTVQGSQTFIGVSDDPNPTTTPKFPENHWVHVGLDIDPTSEIKVHVDGALWLKVNIQGKWISGANPEMVLVLGAVGYTPTGSSPAYSVYYDNASVDFVN